MKNKWYIILLVVGIIFCIAVATYSYFNPMELLPSDDFKGGNQIAKTLTQ